MAIYTYDQFQKAARDAGLLGQFSQADLNLAMKNPDAGMSILKYKQDYLNATTDEQRAQANKGAEGIRSSYGNYTGGGDGGSFHLDPLSPNSYEKTDAPSFSFDTPAPEYSSRYDETIQNMIKDMLERPEFSYDPETDVVWKSYQKAYGREGDRATQNALGAAAAASGGMPSSYATTAAAQAGNYYAAQAADKIPDLFDAAYNRYLNEFQMDASKLGIVQDQEQTDYGRYLDQLGQWNTDRNFAYNKFAGDRAQWNADREFEYNQLLDEINSQTQQRQEALDFANMAAQYGDYNYLKDMGIDTSALEALNAAGGGYSGRGSGGTAGKGTAGTDIAGYQAVFNMAKSMKTSRASDEQINNFLMQQYNAGNIDYAQISYIIAALNNQGAAGSGQSANNQGTVAGNTGTAAGNAGVRLPVPGNGGHGASYSEVLQTASQMANMGRNDMDIMNYLNQSYDAGGITRGQVAQIMTILNIAGYGNK